MVLSVFADDIISDFTCKINNWVKAGESKDSEEFEDLKPFIHSLAFPTSLQRADWRSLSDEKSAIICIICRSFLNCFMKFRKEGMSAEKIRSIVIKFCSLLNLQTKNVCDGAVTINLVSKLNC